MTLGQMRPLMWRNHNGSGVLREKLEETLMESQFSLWRELKTRSVGRPERKCVTITGRIP